VIKDIIGVFIILILVFLLVKNGSDTASIITAMANQTASTVAVLQGRQGVS